MTRTEFSIEELLFHLPHEVNLIDDLESMFWGDLAAHVLASFAEFVCGDAMTVLKFT